MNQALAELRKTVEVPLERARAMPRSVYVSDTYCQLEIERIFRREWFCAGRSEGLPNPGDYIAFELAGQPVMVVRDSDGRLRAQANVCRHRSSTLLEGRGNTKTIVCPYHGWTYGLDGKLRGAPGMGRNETFDRNACRLPPIRLREWLGWILITLDEDAPEPRERLAQASDMVADYAVDEYRQTFFEIHEWNTNWKVLAENFMESYHLPVCHAATIGGLSRVDEIECPEGFDAFNFHTVQKDESFRLSVAHPKNTRLRGERRLMTYLFAIYPSLMITLTPGYFWYLSLHPIAPDRVRFFFGGGLSREFADEPEAEEDFKTAKALLDRVNDEDKRCTERVYAGLCSDFSVPGPLSHLERPNHEFAAYLATMISED